jgi:hypothetical protein
LKHRHHNLDISAFRMSIGLHAQLMTGSFVRLSLFGSEPLPLEPLALMVQEMGS